MISKLAKVNVPQVRYSYSILADGPQATLFCKNINARTQPYTTCEPSQVKDDDKGKQSKSKVPKYFQDRMEDLTKFANAQYDSWSVARVFNSLHLELPKNFQDVREYLTSLQGKSIESKDLNTRQQMVKVEPSPSKQDTTTNDKTDHKPLESSNIPIETMSASTKLPTTSSKLPSTSSKLSSTFSKLQPVQDEYLKAEKNKTLKDQMVTSASEALNSTVNAMWTLSNYLQFNQKSKPAGLAMTKTKIRTEVTKNGGVVMRVVNDALCWETVERNTKYLVYKLRVSTDNTSRVQFLAELCDYFVHFPKARSIAVEGHIIPCLKKLRQLENPHVSGEAHKALSLVGHVNPLKSKGIRILAMDGGGMRGLISLQILKQLELRSNKKVHELFDYICGVSTGSLLGVFTCIFKMSLEEAEEMYKRFSKKIFERSRVSGARSLVLDSSFYDTKIWEELLISNLREKSFVDTMSDPTCPKMSVVSTLMNANTVQNYLFRNYNLNAKVRSTYLGSVEHKIWEAVRASSAAPWYFEEFKLGDYIHQDGGVLTNNPTAIAIHESRLLWPEEEIHSVVSIGTGKQISFLNDMKPASKSSLKEKLVKIIESATDTEGVHSILNDILPRSTYFRFNPSTSETFNLDEIDEKKLLQMKKDAIRYCDENKSELDRAAKQLLIPKNLLNLGKDQLIDFIRN